MLPTEPRLQKFWGLWLVICRGCSLLGMVFGTMPFDWPACPRCGSTEAIICSTVPRAGVYSLN